MIENLFYYDETSPSGIRWNQDRYSWGGRKIEVAFGDVAGSIGNTGYYSVRVNGVLTKCHRIVYELHYGEIDDGLVIDHIDGNPTNNNINNLRPVSRKINSRNRKISKRNTTGVGGVVELRDRDDKSIPIGYAVGWRDPETGRKTSKEFSFKKYGLLLAFEYACQFRDKLFKSFNDNGAGYSDRHIG